ncbi:MAG: hypothetical protein Q7T96_02795 [Methylobacter sp.]|nr:hypothetical protein [Methylobacter sp.]
MTNTQTKPQRSSFPRAAWECSAGRAASRIRQRLVVIRGAARLDCIPTEPVGTRAKSTVLPNKVGSDD